jgi:sugar phosphate isomerase/epimerase
MALAPAGMLAAGEWRPPVVLFSKPLPGLGYPELARTIRQIGLDGVDLTVRAKGHVLPENVERDLPRAWEAFRAEGLSLPMITTELTSASHPAARPILATAARLKIPFFKLGYWRYTAAEDPERTLERVRRDLSGLVSLAREYGLTAGFHNHSGADVGTAVWDLRHLLQGLDARHVGYYFDPAHATVEGGAYGWELSARLALKQLKMVAVKDFLWVKRGAAWKPAWGPLGEGMVNWPRVAAMLKAARFPGPITLHVEYEPADVPAAIARDFERLRGWLRS